MNEGGLIVVSRYLFTKFNANDEWNPQKSLVNKYL